MRSEKTMGAPTSPSWKGEEGRWPKEEEVPGQFTPISQMKKLRTPEHRRLPNVILCSGGHSALTTRLHSLRLQTWETLCGAGVLQGQGPSGGGRRGEWHSTLRRPGCVRVSRTCGLHKGNDSKLPILTIKASASK